MENSIDFFPLCLLKCKYKESIVLHRKVEDFLILKRCLCRMQGFEGRISGAVKIAAVWLIPQNTEKAKDRRRKMEVGK